LIDVLALDTDAW